VAPGADVAVAATAAPSWGEGGGTWAWTSVVAAPDERTTSNNRQHPRRAALRCFTTLSKRSNAGISNRYWAAVTVTSPRTVSDSPGTLAAIFSAHRPAMPTFTPKR
jgi:hypothetical protein